MLENLTADAFVRGSSNGYVADLAALGAIETSKDISQQLNILANRMGDDFNNVNVQTANLGRDIIENRAQLTGTITNAAGTLGVQNERIGSAAGVQVERVGNQLGVQSERIGTQLGVQGEKIGSQLGVQGERIGSTVGLQISTLGAALGVQAEKIGNNIGIQNEKIATDSQVLIEKTAAALCLQIATSGSAAEIQSEKLAAAANLQAERISAASALLAYQNAAAQAAKACECCCEIKEKIRCDGGETRALINELDRRNADRRENDLKIDLSNSRQNEHIRHMMDEQFERLSRRPSRFYDSHDQYFEGFHHGHGGHHGHDGHHDGPHHGNGGE